MIHMRRTLKTKKKFKFNTRMKNQMRLKKCLLRNLLQEHKSRNQKVTKMKRKTIKRRNLRSQMIWKKESLWMKKKC